MESLQTGWRTPGDACAAIFALIVRYVRLVGFGVLIGLAFSWLAAAAICASPSSELAPESTSPSRQVEGP